MQSTVRIPRPSSEHDTAALAARLEELEAELATWREYFRLLGVTPSQSRPVLYVVRGGAA